MPAASGCDDWRPMRHRAKVRNRNGCHRATTAIVRRHGLIAVE